MATHTLAALIAIGIAIAVAGIAIGVLIAEQRHDQRTDLTSAPNGAQVATPDPYRGLSTDARRILGVPTQGTPQ